MAQPRAPGTPSLDGPAFRDMFVSGMASLEAQGEYVNSLNVFPVPDGDTGTNLLLTMRSALDHAQGEPAGAAAMAEVLAKGALMGARGNAGVIFSQIMRGFHRGIEGRERLSGSDLPRAFEQASAYAYKAVSKPVEGTILTVVREVAQALHQQGPKPLALPAAFDLAAATAKEWVLRTPDLMPLLKENGVVDSGAQGLAAILEGMSRYASGDRRAPPARAALAAQAGHAGLHNTPPEFGQRYGFCTEFFIEHSAQDVEMVRRVFQALGSSVMVAGDEELVKVHLHTLEPEAMFARARGFGSLGPTKVEDMDAQHQQWRRKRSLSAPTAKTGVVAVAAGEGFAELFRSLGAAEIVPGGQSMNPSAREILEAIQAVQAPEVVVLPNNKNIILAANQARHMLPARAVTIVPTADLPQGISAMFGFNFELGAAENAKSMEEARAAVTSGEVSRAVRAATLDGRAVAEGDAIGLSSGKLLVACRQIEQAVVELVALLGLEDGSTVTLYSGLDVPAEDAARLQAELRERYPEAEVQVLAGGQPHYHYLIAVE